MKKLVHLLVILLFGNQLFAQLYVKTGSYVFNKGNVVYATGNVQLDAGSNFYLRNEGQFVQGTSGTSTNLGAGTLSVFQEGTKKAYAYNYWCSPVGNASTTVGNEPFGITMLNVPTSTTASTAATILPIGSYDGSSGTGTVSIAPYWIWKYQSSNIYALDAGGWTSVFANPTLAAGQGFTMKGVNGTDATNVSEATTNNPSSAQRYDFRGKPNDGNINVGVATGDWTLTGNPYPSALDVSLLLLDASNTACNATAYYWEQDNTTTSHVLTNYRGGYGTFVPNATLLTLTPAIPGIYAPATYNSYNADGTLNTTGSSSGLSMARRYAPIGQGFMLFGNSTGTVTIKNAHRAFYKESSLGNSYFAKNNSTSQVTTDALSLIRLNTTYNNQIVRQTVLSLIPEATDGVDRGMDGLSPDDDGSLPIDNYFFLDNHRYVIESINFDVNKRVPLGVATNADNTTFRFSIADLSNFDPAQDIFIYDALDNSYHNLKISDYEVTLATGIINNRFQLTFRDLNAELNNTTNVKDNFVVIQNNTNQILTAFNPNLLDVKTITLFDITGKLIFDKANLGVKPNYQFSTAPLSEGVYIMKLESTDGKSLTQKIIIEKQK